MTPRAAAPKKVAPASPSALASVTKGELNAVTLSLATEYAARGVRVNAVALREILHIDGGQAAGH